MSAEHDTDFGFRRVARGAKRGLVDGVFSSVAERYDLMNDLMSGGLHRLWKRFAIARLAPRRGERFLDCAAGTGDMGRLIAERLRGEAWIVLADPNAAMLGRGRDRMLDQGRVAGLGYVQATAEALPFAPASFDALTIAFGLRNASDRQQALAAMFEVLAPGGRLLVLEFSQLVLPLLQRLYDAYSFKAIPWLGEQVTGDRASYEYLVESIRMHPDQAALAGMMREAGFEEVTWHNLSGGIVAVHLGYRL